MARILLIAATTGYQTRAFADAARRQGLDVTLATDRCHVLEDPWRDRAVAIRFEEPEQSARILSALPERPDGIVAVADRSTLVAALTAERCGIAWHPSTAVRLCRNKSLMRRAFDKASMPGPWTFSVSVDSEPATAAARAEYPCVLKPLGLSASRGVIRANDPDEFSAAFGRIRRILGLPEIRHFRDDADRLIQVEQYIPGHEFAIEGIMSRGELKVLAIFDKPDPLEGPFFEETIYVTVPADASDRRISCCASALKALGLYHGPMHAEMRVNSEGVFMLEVAARPIGGLCARSLRFQHDMSLPDMTLEDLIVLHAVDAMPDRVEPAASASGVMMIPAPGAGILQSVTGVDRARAAPWITGVEITAKTGETLVPLPEGASYPGFIFAEAPDAATVEAALRQAHRELRFNLLAALPTLG